MQSYSTPAIPTEGSLPPTVLPRSYVIEASDPSSFDSATLHFDLDESSVPSGTTVETDITVYKRETPGGRVYEAQETEVVEDGELAVTVSDFSEFAFGVEEEQSIQRALSVSQVWNMVGMPVKPGGKDLGALLPSACGSGFRWQPEQGSYQEFGSSETLSAGEGVWTFCESGGTAEVKGTPVSSSEKTVQVEGGWNQVGPFETAIAPGEVGQDPSGILETGTWFRWDPEQGSYTEPSVLGPGAGYWVFATGSGALDFSGGGSKQATAAAASARPKEDASAREKPEGALTLRVADEAGRSQEVYLASQLSESERQRWRLPPVGPGNTFAVRFAGGFRAAEAGGDSPVAFARKGAVLRVRDAEGPVTLRLQAPEGQSSGNQSFGKQKGGRFVRVTDAATGGERLAAKLTRESPSAQVPVSTRRLRLSVESVPAEAALQTPYPNPASGEVNLQYALPERREVRITVYDVLGRKVSKLANGKKQVGTHRAVLEASQLPSGTYFVRMQAGSFQKTRRVTVVK